MTKEILIEKIDRKAAYERKLRLLMYYQRLLDMRNNHAEDLCEKIRKQLKYEKEKDLFVAYLENKLTQLEYESILVYRMARPEEKTVPVTCIKKFWVGLRRILKKEINWENQVYEKLKEIVSSHPLLGRIVIAVMSVAVGLSGEILHDFIQKKYAQPDQKIVYYVYMPGSGEDISQYVIENGKFALDPEGNLLATDSDARMP